jgi:hypothetical protein
MSATPEKAEAAPKDGLATPSTTWWMRCRTCNTQFLGVNLTFLTAHQAPGIRSAPTYKKPESGSAGGGAVEEMGILNDGFWLLNGRVRRTESSMPLSLQIP